MSGILVFEACFDFYKKWRQNLDFERSGKGFFWKTRKSTLLENPISKPFTKIENPKFCRHFFLHWIHEWVLVLLKMVSVNGGPKKFFYARTLRVLAPHILQIKQLTHWFVIDYMVVCCRSSLKMFYKKICWEKIDDDCFVVVGPSALSQSVHLRGA